MVNYLHETPVNIPTVHTSSVTAAIAHVSALSILLINPSDNKCQEIMDEIPSTNYGKNSPVEIMTKSLTMQP